MVSVMSDCVTLPQIIERSPGNSRTADTPCSCSFLLNTPKLTLPRHDLECPKFQNYLNPSQCNKSLINGVRTCNIHKRRCKKCHKFNLITRVRGSMIIGVSLYYFYLWMCYNYLYKINFLLIKKKIVYKNKNRNNCLNY